MAKKTKLVKAAESVGAAAGRATNTAHKVTKAAKVARKEFAVKKKM